MNEPAGLYFDPHLVQYGKRLSNEELKENMKYKTLREVH